VASRTIGSRAQRRRQHRAAGRLGQSLSLPSGSPLTLLDRIRLIARTLEEHPGLTSQDLAERIGCGRRNTSLLLLRLEEHGHVLHEGRRWFPGHVVVR
jgi:DNA-binding MarR family transcriptional regulator